MSPALVTTGQVWVPKPQTAPGGGGTIRVVCRYPFATEDDAKGYLEELRREFPQFNDYRVAAKRLPEIRRWMEVNGWHTILTASRDGSRWKLHSMSVMTGEQRHE